MRRTDANSRRSLSGHAHGITDAITINGFDTVGSTSGDNRWMRDRRRHSPSSPLPLAVLQQMPALVALERIPVPVLAVAEDGTITFANTAFAEMVGSTQDAVLSLRFDQIFTGAATRESALDVVHACANVIVRLTHRDGSTVRALMSKSALKRCDDQLALATFQDLTERLWVDGR